ncbi:DUF4239 domain-containing protein [Sesbania bispinosa]|nr:DUF4239 domain-containing protein [Sesbania bispinosa]
MAEPVETEAAMKMPQYGQSAAGEWPTWLSDGEESSSDVGRCHRDLQRRFARTELKLKE